MNPEEVIARAQDALTVRRVFGDSVEVGGVTLIPVASVRGCGCACAPGAERAGAGYRVRATPTGMFVVSDGNVRWRPAIDVNRIVLGGQMVGIAAIIGGCAVLRALLKARGSSAVTE